MKNLGGGDPCRGCFYDSVGADSISDRMIAVIILITGAYGMRPYGNAYLILIEATLSASGVTYAVQFV